MNDNAKPSGKSDAFESGPQRLSESMDDGAPASSSQSESEALSEARAEVDKFKNEYLYQRAEFENFKRQIIKERSDMRKYGSERLIADLLGVLDIFETALALQTTPESIANFRKGIEMTASELRNVLQRHGVQEVASQGQPFDPSLHEALSSEATDTMPPGTITNVFKKAYKLHDRVVRPGQVVVAKSKA